jgi:hypothetical protein
MQYSMNNGCNDRFVNPMLRAVQISLVPHPI